MEDEFDSLDQTISGATYRVLLQIALLGTEMGENSRAMEIAETLEELRPDLPHAKICLAMNDFSTGRRDDGIRGLEATLARFPDSQLTKAMLAVCLEIVGRSGWQQLLESVIDDGRDEYAIGLACAVLGRPVEATQGGAESSSAHVPPNAMWA